MKTLILSLLLLISTLNYTQTLYPESELTHQTKIQGYFFKGDNIVFVFDQKTNQEVIKKHLKDNTKITAVNLRGTFNSWKDVDGWQMKKAGDENIWFLEKKVSEIFIPGNSGSPEFKFYAEGEYEKDGKLVPTSSYLQPVEELPIGYKFSDQFEGECNYLVIFKGDDIAEIAKNHQQAILVKTEFASDEELSNFRAVTSGALGKGKLFRTYHPFIKSKKYEVENKRLAKIQELMVANKIKSVINLSDNSNIVTNPKMPEYYKNIATSGNVLFYETGYNDVYFRSEGDSIVKLVENISKFVISHEPPYMVHCRLGTDRTGMVTAFLEAFMGATWKEIVDDYKRSNDAGLGEYRNEKLLKYSFERLFNVKLLPETKVRELVIKYLKERVKLTDKEIDELYEKLK